MQPPRFKALSREDFRGAPSWFEPLFILLNEVLGGVVRGLAQGLTRRENFASGIQEDIVFTSDGSGFLMNHPVKNQLPFRPSHCWVTRLARDDGAALLAPWSMSWKLNQKNQLEVSMQGLDDTAKYVMSLVYE